MTQRRSNVLLITADDMDVASPSCFGGPTGSTPHIDALAAQGARFTRAHVVAAVCQPSRSAIMTGLLPHRNGAEGFEPINDGIRLLTDLLAEAGYALGILGKVDHLAPVERFGWDLIRTMQDLGLGRDPHRYADGMRAFLAQSAGRPWFLMANAHDPHRPFHGSEQERLKWDEAQCAAIPAPSMTYAEGQGDVPGFLPDIPGVRREYAEYLSSVRRCDDVVGSVLGVLAASGQADDTIVIFLSDNGMAFPFAKANCYLRSTLTPMVVRWPRHVPGGSVDDSLVSSLDLFPTLCDALELTRPADLDGISLWPALNERRPVPRETLFTVFHETSARRRFEMRCAQNRRHGYIWNGWAGDGRQYRAENMEGLSWPAMVEAAGSSSELAERTRFYLQRPLEELYDLESDPDCLTNLASDPTHASVLHDFRARLLGWMTEHGDPQLKTFRLQTSGRALP